MRIVIETEATGPVLAELDSERCPKTVTAIREALPIEAVARRWGEEVYFEVPAVVEPEAPVELVAVGDLGYWPPGQAMCIFFGPTPASRSPGEIRPASPVNPIGQVLSDPKVFSEVRDGERIVVRAA